MEFQKAVETAERVCVVFGPVAAGMISDGVMEDLRFMSPFDDCSK